MLYCTQELGFLHLSHDLPRADALFAGRGVPKTLWQWFSGQNGLHISRTGGLVVSRSVNCTWTYIGVLNAKDTFPEPHKDQHKFSVTRSPSVVFVNTSDLSRWKPTTAGTCCYSCRAKKKGHPVFRTPCIFEGTRCRRRNEHDLSSADSVYVFCENNPWQGYSALILWRMH